MYFNRVRIERSQLELEHLSSGVQDWLTHRKESDRDDEGNYIGQHHTQLETLGAVLTEALDTLKTGLETLDTGRDTGEVYDECRDADEAIVWVRRLWEYFKEKYDQRDDAQRTGPLLKAADEVVWSCYNQVFVQARMLDPTLKKGPSPLAFIEPQYSPSALESDKPLPPDLRLSPEVTFLDDFIKTLPIPVLSLPPWCVEAPWWLIYAGHEVGHHVQHDLKLIPYFREGIKKAALARNLSTEDAEMWGRWSEEIFADIFSVIMLGGWAVWAVAEAERSSASEMVRRKDRYPSPIIRLALMVVAARKLGADTSEALTGIDVAALLKSDRTVELDALVVPGAIEFALGPMRDGLGTLPKLCGLGSDRHIKDAERHGEQLKDAVQRREQQVGTWINHLHGDESIQPVQRPETAREVVCASLQAWRKISMIEVEETRAQRRESLAEITKRTLRENAPAGVRAAQSAEVAGKGEELINRLLNVTRQRRAQGRP